MSATTKKIVITVTGNFTFPPTTAPALSAAEVGLTILNAHVTKAKVDVGNSPQPDACEFHLTVDEANISFI